MAEEESIESSMVRTDGKEPEEAALLCTSKVPSWRNEISHETGSFPVKEGLAKCKVKPEVLPPRSRLERAE